MIFELAITMLSCARISQFYAKGVFDNITNYIQQTKNWKNAYGIEGCPLSNNCVNKSDAYQNFMGVPPVKWNGNMHCWWPGNGRDNQSGQCASRYGTGTNDYVQTSFPKVGG